MAHLTNDYLQHLYDTFGELKVLDDVIRHRAADNPPAPILGYPRGDTADDYEAYTGERLDSFIDAAAKYFIACGLKGVRYIDETVIHGSRLMSTSNRILKNQLPSSPRQMST